MKLESSDCLTKLNLDKRCTQFLHVKEKWEIKVQIDAPEPSGASGKVIEEEVYSCDTFQRIHVLVKKEMGLDDVQIFYGKRPVKEEAKIATVCTESLCKLFATHPADEDRKKEYFKK